MKSLIDKLDKLRTAYNRKVGKTQKVSLTEIINSEGGGSFKSADHGATWNRVTTENVPAPKPKVPTETEKAIASYDATVSAKMTEIEKAKSGHPTKPLLNEPLRKKVSEPEKLFKPSANRPSSGFLTQEQLKNQRELATSLAKRAGITFPTYDMTNDDWADLAHQAGEMLDALPKEEKLPNTDPTWYFPNQGYYICRVSGKKNDLSSMRTAEPGQGSNGVFIRSDRTHLSAVSRLSRKGTLKYIQFEAGKGGPYYTHEVLPDKEFNDIINNKSSWEVLKKVFDWDGNFYGNPKFNLNTPTVVY